MTLVFAKKLDFKIEKTNIKLYKNEKILTITYNIVIIDLRL